MLIPAGILLALFIYAPLARGLAFAFQRYRLLDLSSTGWNGLENFRDVILDPDTGFGRVLINSLIWVAASLVLQFLLGFGLALLLWQPFRGRGIVTSLVFYPWALSGFAIGLVWAWIFNGQFGLVNDALLRAGIIAAPIGFLSEPRFAMLAAIAANVWYGIPFFAIMLLAALQSVPRQLFESAAIDGAGPVRRLFAVTIPHIRPTIAGAVLLRILWIMNFPDIIYGMTGGGPAGATTILSTLMVDSVLKEGDYGRASAVGVVIIALLFGFAFMYLRKSERGGAES